jgi:hypothetical protein
MDNTMQIGRIIQNASRYSIQKGYLRVPLGDKEVVKNEILDVFGHHSRPFWTAILYGRKPLTVDQMEAIEKVFADHRIKKSQIWG